jgi:ribonuclease J
MRIIIHRGTQEIGGSCVEVSTDKTKILIDFGIPLVTATKEPFDSKVLTGKSIEDLKKLKILPDVKGIYKGEQKEIDALLVSHSHPDHYGLLNYIHPEIPVYLSQGAKELIEISNIFTPNKIKRLNAKVINTKKSFTIGGLTITPYVVDHSAFDALAFLIEGESKRLFYSGDFRGHGRKSILFKQMLRNPPKDIDCLLMEGTSLGRGEKLCRDENMVQKRIQEILKEGGNITFLFVSSQNIDRIVSAYKACLTTNSIFIIDVYTAYILERLKKISRNIPQFDWRNIRVKFYDNHYKVITNKESLKTIYLYRKSKIDFNEINSSGRKVLMMGRDNLIFPKVLRRINNPKGAKIIYSEGCSKLGFLKNR